jgi:tetratricopeptide (TPR) repeat protein
MRKAIELIRHRWRGRRATRSSIAAEAPNPPPLAQPEHSQLPNPSSPQPDQVVPTLREINRKYLGLPRLTVWGAFGGLIVLIGLVASLIDLGDYFQRPAGRMTGDFRVAIAAFEVAGPRENRPMGEDLAHGVYLRMEEELEELSPDFATSIWSPEQVGTVRGATQKKRAEAAARTAVDIEADIVVYGLVDTSQPVWTVTPEFYISDQNLTDAQEITGQHEIGEPFEVVGQGSVATRIEVSTQMSTRAQLISVITVGLAYYAALDYPRAQTVFEQLERDFDWSEVGGEEVLYLLLGNAAGKNDALDTAERAYRRALAENPDYSRAYAGLGSTYYMRALEPVEASGNGADIDRELLNNSIDSFHQAAAATVRPALSDIPAKVHFGLGQAYLALHLQNESEPVARAVQEFDTVISEYDAGDNPRIRHLAAESHARLGLIYDLNGNRDAAIDEYEAAVSLLDDVPDRRRLYEDRLRELRNDVPG